MEDKISGALSPTVKAFGEVMQLTTEGGKLFTDYRIASAGMAIKAANRLANAANTLATSIAQGELRPRQGA